MSSTSERKARPIYDALDCRNYKSALNTCNKLLKKGDNELIKALKALSLQKLERSNESYELCKEIARNKPTDEGVLQAVAQALKSMGNHAEVVELYENALAPTPHNEELLAHLFMANIRARSYKKAQQVAVKLSKLVKGNRYLMWNIMSMVLQYVYPPVKGSQDKLMLTLAERMLEKLLNENKLQSVEELKLYLIVLDLQNKAEQKLKILEGETGDKMKIQVERRKLELEELLKLNRFDILKIKAKKAAEEYGDWFAFECLFRSKKELQESSFNEELEWLSGLLKKNIKDRNVRLAQLEILQMAGRETELYEALKEYYEDFGDKYCFAKDVERFSVKGFDEFLDNKLKECTESALGLQDKSQKIMIVNRFVGIFKLKYFQKQLQAQAVPQLRELYAAYIDAFSELEETEKKSVDDLLIIAVALIIAESRDAEPETKFKAHVEAISILESVISNSRFNFHAKIFLIRLYILMGCATQALTVYNTLDIKSVLHETLSYLISDHLQPLGDFREFGESVLPSSMSIYNQNRKETPEMICQAFKYTTFSKIIEFTEFFDKIEFSKQRFVLEILKEVQKMLFEGKVSPSVLKQDLFLYDNRDRYSTGFSDLEINTRIGEDAHAFNQASVICVAMRISDIKEDIQLLKLNLKQSISPGFRNAFELLVTLFELAVSACDVKTVNASFKSVKQRLEGCLWGYDFFASLFYTQLALKIATIKFNEHAVITGLISTFLKELDDVLGGVEAAKERICKLLTDCHDSQLEAIKKGWDASCKSLLALNMNIRGACVQ